MKLFSDSLRYEIDTWFLAIFFLLHCRKLALRDLACLDGYLLYLFFRLSHSWLDLACLLPYCFCIVAPTPVAQLRSPGFFSNCCASGSRLRRAMGLSHVDSLRSDSVSTLPFLQCHVSGSCDRLRHCMASMVWVLRRRTSHKVLAFISMLQEQFFAGHVMVTHSKTITASSSLQVSLSFVSSGGLLVSLYHLCVRIVSLCFGESLSDCPCRGEGFYLPFAHGAKDVVVVPGGLPLSDSALYGQWPQCPNCCKTRVRATWVGSKADLRRRAHRQFILQSTGYRLQIWD